jgi:hypothetical protein
MVSNIFKHPKTSVAGVLIAVSSIAGVLSQNGITLGHAGTGTVIALIASLASALLGCVSRDPGTAAPQLLDHKPVGVPPDSKLGVIALCVLLVSSLLASGCTQAQKVNVANEIVNWTPAIESAVTTIAATAALLDPAAAPVFETATTGLHMLASGLSAAARAYLTNPNQTNLQLLQTLVVELQQNVNKGLLQAAHIENPNSQRTALAAINGLATAVNAVLALVQSVSTKAQVQAMAAHVSVTYAMVRPYVDQGRMAAAAARVRTDLALPRAVSADAFFTYEAQAGF